MDMQKAMTVAGKVHTGRDIRYAARHCAEQGFNLMLQNGLFNGTMYYHVGAFGWSFDADAWRVTVLCPNGKTYTFKPAKSWVKGA